MSETTPKLKRFYIPSANNGRGRAFLAETKDEAVAMSKGEMPSKSQKKRIAALKKSSAKDSSKSEEDVPELETSE
jgi:hypothetical protein